VIKVPNQERLLKAIASEREKLTQGSDKDKLLAYKLTFDSDPGRRVLADLEVSYGGISLTPGYPDVTAFKEGRRSVLDDIKAILRIAEALRIAPPPPTERR